MSDATAELDRRIASAMAALHGARQAMDYCPSGENALMVETCQHTLDDLLDCRLAMSKADGMVTA